MASTKNYSVLSASIILSSPIILHSGWVFDDSVWVINLFKNDKFYFFKNAFNGIGDRFQPTHQLFNQILTFFTCSPVSYSIYGFLIAIISLFLLNIIFDILNLRNKYLLLCIIFTPAFSSHFYLIHTSKELLLLWSLFIIFLILLNQHRARMIISLSAIFVVVIAVFMKETSFVLCIIFSTFLIITKSNKIFLYLYNNKKDYYICKNTKTVLIASLSISILFLFMYAVFTNHEHYNSYLYSMTPYNSISDRLTYSIRALFLYAISDPLLVVLLPTALAHSIFKRKKNKSKNLENLPKYMHFIDACALSAIALVMAYILLGIHQARYLLPAYPFGVIALAGYCETCINKKKNMFKRAMPKILLTITSILIINSAFSAINIATFNKVSSYTFMKYKDSLIKNIEDSAPEEKQIINCYLPGNKEISYRVARHKDILEFYDVDIGYLRFAYNKKNQNWISPYENNNTSKDSLEKGDLILITPNSTIPQKHIMANLQRYNLREIMHTKATFYFEIPEIRHLVKYFMIRKNTDNLDSKSVYREVDFAIYKVS